MAGEFFPYAQFCVLLERRAAVEGPALSMGARASEAPRLVRLT